MRQAVAKLTDLGVVPGLIAPGATPSAGVDVFVASIQTAIRRQLPEDIGLCIVDEAHHSPAPGYRRLAAMLPRARLLGVTATPARLDGKGLGIHAGGLFDDLVLGPTVRELTPAWLCPARIFADPAGTLSLEGVRVVAGDYHPGELAEIVTAADLIGSAVRQYARRAAHQPAVAFCPTVAHAEAAAAEFRTQGYRAACIHGGLRTAERDRLIAAFGSGELELLTSCEILGEGVDVPEIRCVILLRPTMSLTVHLQQIGRGLRPAAGKECLMVLDLVGNCLVHGPPDEPRRWTLDRAPRGEAGGWEISEAGEVVRTPFHERAILSAAERIAGLPYHVFMSRPRSDAEIAAYREARGYKLGWMFYARREMALRGSMVPP